MSGDLLYICKRNAHFDSQRKCWEADFISYPTIYSELKQYSEERNKIDKNVKINVIDIPAFVNKLLLRESLNINLKVLKTSFLEGRKTIKIEIDYTDKILYDEKILTDMLREKTFQYQKDGMKFFAERKGRILLADEMGVGKTIQAIGMAYMCKSDWPVLVICPASLKFNWRNEIAKWSNCSFDDIQVVNKGSDPILPGREKFCIISYDITRSDDFNEELKSKKFNFIIADEAHALKNAEAKRSKLLLPLLKQSKRVILITGTPILSKPVEIFNQISCIRPDLFNNYHQFTNRYCDPKVQFYGTDYSGTSNLRELNYILDNFMIRRLKKEVLSQLPEKIRQKIEVTIDPQIAKQIEFLISKNKKSFQKTMEKYINEIEYKDENTVDNNSNPIQNVNNDINESTATLYQKAYALTGQAKIEGIISYINYLVSEDQSFLLFAHHMIVLDKLEERIKDLKKEYKTLKYIRIDGKTNPKERTDLVQIFQNTENYKIALLSITACAVGLTLTKASIVVFAELFFTPAIMIQAEDRVHRIGQKNNVQVKYLVGNKTLDDEIFDALNQKITIVTEALDNCKKDMEVGKYLKLKDEMYKNDFQKEFQGEEKFLKTINKKDSDKQKDVDKVEVRIKQTNLDMFYRKGQENILTSNKQNDLDKKKLQKQNISKIDDSEDIDTIDSWFNDDDQSTYI